MPTPKRILIIDDDQTILVILKDLLRDAHYAVETPNPAQAIEAALNNPPDLILLDMLMPVDGVQVAQTLRADSRTSYVPIVAISAAYEIEEMARRADVDAVLKKPFDFNQVLATIEHLIGDA